MRTAEARNPAMPTRANAAGLIANDAGRIARNTTPVASPSEQPQTRAGAKTPADPPEPTVNDVASALKKNTERYSATVPRTPSPPGDDGSKLSASAITPKNRFSFIMSHPFFYSDSFILFSSYLSFFLFLIIKIETNFSIIIRNKFSFKYFSTS